MKRLVAELKQDDRNASVTSPQVGVVFQLRRPFEQIPTALVAFTPVLAVNTVRDLARVHHTAQRRLKSDAKLASESVRPITVNDLEQFQPMALRTVDLRAQPGARLIDTG